LRTLLSELGAFRPALLERPRFVVYSRGDLAIGRTLPELDGQSDTPRISAHTGEGITPLLHRIVDRLDAMDQETVAWDPPTVSEAAPEIATESFADRVDAGTDLGAEFWPRAYYVDAPRHGAR
ncbi:MAG: hypothetical protein KC729_10190, partial [Candidatus Eisenbacteria bacterium]|nr:hypothetical protein [Candidatus Eisenbacteria bacterium]